MYRARCLFPKKFLFSLNSDYQKVPTMNGISALAITCLARTLRLYPKPPKTWGHVEQYIQDLKILEDSLQILEVTYQELLGAQPEIACAFLETKIRVRFNVIEAKWCVRHRKNGGCKFFDCGPTCTDGLKGSEEEFNRNLNKITIALRNNLYNITPRASSDF